MNAGRPTLVQIHKPGMSEVVCLFHSHSPILKTWQRLFDFFTKILNKFLFKKY